MPAPTSLTERTDGLADLTFYLGAPEPSWLSRCTDVPLFVSLRRLARRKGRHRPATTSWAMDSGGFNEITKRGGWTITAEQYAREVAYYDETIGRMDWAAPQDWMCEDEALAATGLTTAEHIARTVDNFAELTEAWPWYSDATMPIMPVLQGAAPDGSDHLACIERYKAAGVDLTMMELVGIGSVCRLQNTGRIREVVTAIAGELPGVPLHGFGVKENGLRQVADLLASADSMAWSKGAFHRDVRHPECTHRSPRCTWCPRAAMAWREEIVGDRTWGWFAEHGPSPWERLVEERRAYLAREEAA